MKELICICFIEKIKKNHKNSSLITGFFYFTKKTSTLALLFVSHWLEKLALIFRVDFKYLVFTNYIE